MTLLDHARVRHAWFGIVLASGVMMGTSWAQAGELTDSLAVSFKEQGDRAMTEGDFAGAVTAYGKGARIQSHPVFDFNLARALQALGRFAEALDCLERFERDAPPELREKVPALDEMMRNLRENVGELVLEGEPIAARVTGNGVDLGRFEPGKPIRCNRGVLDLTVTARGYVPISQRIVVAAQQTTRLTIDWVRVDDRARIIVTTSIPAARVFIDDELAGQSPIEVKVQPGSHRLRLEHEDAPTIETSVVVSARESRRLSLEMPQHTPIWAKWWFWTGTAAVAAGLVVTGIALSTSKSPTPGDIQPGVVSAPLVSFP